MAAMVLMEALMEVSLHRTAVAYEAAERRVMSDVEKMVGFKLYIGLTRHKTSMAMPLEHRLAEERRPFVDVGNGFEEVDPSRIHTSHHAW